MQLVNAFALNLIAILLLSMGRHCKKVWKDQQRGVNRQRLWIWHLCKHWHLYATLWVTLTLFEGIALFIWVVGLGHRN